MSRIIKIDKNNMVNGPGLRAVVWFSGCSHNCKGCHNKEAQNPNNGTEFGQWVYDELAIELSKPEIFGVTFSGGEATFCNNINAATELAKWITENYPNKTIWMYTGYLFEKIKDLEIFKYIDVCVDGPYIESLNPGFNKIKWRGSSNQRIINVKESITKNETVLMLDFNGRPY